MAEREAERVQRLSGKRDRPQQVRAVDVALLADERVAAQPCLYADLVALAGDEAHFDQRGLAIALDHAVLADRFLASRIARMRLFLNERLLIPHESIAPLARRGIWTAVHHGLIHARRFVPQELILERSMSRGVLGDHHEAGRVAI